MLGEDRRKGRPVKGNRELWWQLGVGGHIGKRKAFQKWWWCVYIGNTASLCAGGKGLAEGVQGRNTWRREGMRSRYTRGFVFGTDAMKCKASISGGHVGGLIENS